MIFHAGAFMDSGFRRNDEKGDDAGEPVGRLLFPSSGIPAFAE
jgi:hypothetical protein